MKTRTLALTLATLVTAAISALAVAPRIAVAQPTTKTLDNNPITGVTESCSNSSQAGMGQAGYQCNVVITTAKTTCTLVFHTAADGLAAFNTIRDTSGSTTSQLTCGVDGITSDPYVLDTAQSTITYGSQTKRFFYRF
jgi:hypothetical protein